MKHEDVRIGMLVECGPVYRVVDIDPEPFSRNDPRCWLLRDLSGHCVTRDAAVLDRVEIEGDPYPISWLPGDREAQQQPEPARALAEGYRVDWETVGRVLDWAYLSGLSCVASKTIASRYIGKDLVFPHNPRDGDDFDRCEAFLRRFPDARPCLEELARFYHPWSALLEGWGILAAMMRPTRHAMVRDLLQGVEGEE